MPQIKKSFKPLDNQPSGTRDPQRALTIISNPGIWAQPFHLPIHRNVSKKWEWGRTYDPHHTEQRHYVQPTNLWGLPEGDAIEYNSPQHIVDDGWLPEFQR